MVRLTPQGSRGLNNIHSGTVANLGDKRPDATATNGHLSVQVASMTFNTALSCRPTY